jgi:hypothetical protein
MCAIHERQNVVSNRKALARLLQGFDRPEKALARLLQGFDRPEKALARL